MTIFKLLCCALLAVAMFSPIHYAQRLPDLFGQQQFQETRRQPGDHRISGPQGFEEVVFPQGQTGGQTPWQEVNRPPWEETSNPFEQVDTGNRQQQGNNNGNFNGGFGQGNNGNFNGGSRPGNNNGNFNGGSRPGNNNGNFNGGSRPGNNNGNFNGGSRPGNNNGQGNFNGGFGQENFNGGNNGNFNGNNGGVGQQGNNNNGGSWQGGNNRPATTRRPTVTRATTRRPATTQATTTPSPSISAPSGCSCTSTSEYNPVCGTNNQTYSNPGKLNCAAACQRRNLQQQNNAAEITVLHFGVCRTTNTDTRG